MSDAPLPPYDPPLLGVRVIDLVSGPMRAVGRHLVDLGAHVTRVPGLTRDPEDGGPVAGGVALGAAIAARGTHEADAAEWAGLLATADILIEDTLPGTDAEAALDVAAIRAAHPALVVLSISDFGRGNDFSSWRATTPVFHALTSELSRSGIPGRDPLLPPGELPYAAAAAQAVFETLSLYLDRLRTGTGDRIDFAVLDGAMRALDPAFGMVGSASAGVPLRNLPRGRAEERHRYPIIACADGYARICVLARRQWRGMFAWMGEPAEFADPEYDSLAVRFRSTTLLPAIARFFAGKTRAEIEREGQEHGVPTSAVLTLDEALATDQIAARGFLRDVELAPGLTAPVPAGVVEVDGARAYVDEPPTGPRGAVAVDGAARAWVDAPSRPPTPGTPAARPASPAAGPAEARGSGEAEAAGGPHLPLAGLRVLDLGVIVVGGDTGRLFGDLGADVIKIENSAFPDGSRAAQGATGILPGFAAGHRNKRAIGVNLRDPEGLRLARELVRTSDIVLTNFKPGVLETLGLDYDSLKDVNPGVVVVDSSAFGPTGPWSRRMGYGPLVRAAAGVTDMWVYPGEPGTFSDAMTVYPDHVSARVGAFTALALLVRRERTARGGAVSVAQAEVMLGHLSTPIAAAALARRGHPAPDGRGAPWGLFPCAGDDEWVAVTVRSGADWTALCGVLGRTDLAADPELADAAGRGARRADVDAAVAEWTSRHTPWRAMELLQAAGVPAGAMLRAADMLEWDYYRQRGAFRAEPYPPAPEPYVLENTQIHAAGVADPPTMRAPLLGEQTHDVARDLLGLADDEIADLVRRGVLEVAPPT